MHGQPHIRLLKNLLGWKIQPGPINKLKTVKRAMNSDWSNYSHDNKIQTYASKFSTPQTACVEKIVKLHGFMFINQEI